ncbi:MAG TPA: hypothetical protein VFZ62_01380 [Candidatus Saccharimonadales bacterium]
MEIRKLSEARRHDNTAACTAYEYGMPTGEIDSAVVELSGRYPDEGWVFNTACTALVHVIKGEGRVLTPGGERELGEDDQVLIKPDERYAFEGDLKLLFSATPAWSPDQARHEK